MLLTYVLVRTVFFAPMSQNVFFFSIFMYGVYPVIFFLLFPPHLVAFSPVLERDDTGGA